MRQSDLAELLQSGPKTNRELQDLSLQPGPVIADCVSRLIRRGIVRRIDGGHGRGSIATYCLVPNEDDTAAKDQVVNKITTTLRKDEFGNEIWHIALEIVGNWTLYRRLLKARYPFIGDAITAAMQGRKMIKR